MKHCLSSRHRVLLLAFLAIAIALPLEARGQSPTKQQAVSASSPKRGYTISKETTYFTGPLKPDGTIDFVAAINEHFARGVTPENNGARVIVPLLDPDNWGRDNAGRRDRALQAMGLDPKNCPANDAFAELGSYFGPSHKDLSQIEKDHAAALQRPWTEDEFPQLSEWLAGNQDALAEISRAAKKDRYFVPFVVEGESDSLVQILLAHVQAIRGVARAFAVRANNHMAHQRWNEAWADILAIKDLARLTAQGQTIVERLVGVAVTSIACHSATQFISRADPKEVDWPALQESWIVQPNTNISEALGVTERAMFVQLACNIWDDPDGFSLGIGGEPFAASNDIEFAISKKVFVAALHGMLTTGEINLDDTLRFSNGIYDRAIAIAEMPDPIARNEAFELLEARIVNRDWVAEERSALLNVFLAKPEKPEEQFAKSLLGLVFPSAQLACHAVWRGQSSQQVVELALAARVLQSQTGHLPGSLRELEPLVEESNFIQPSSGDPIAFRAEDRGILIYHWNANRKDDGGIIDDEPGSDWGIRIKE